MPFFYQRGKVTTTKPWSRPTHSNIAKLLSYALPFVYSNNLQLRIMGKCLTDIQNTWDADMFLTGEIINQDLEDIMHNMIDFSFNKCNLLLDLNWFSDYLLEEKDENNIWHNRKIYRKFLNPIVKQTDLQSFNVDKSLDPTCTKLTNYLCQTNFNPIIPEKHYAKIKANNGSGAIIAQDWLIKINCGN
jgi:hypothetical protein